MLGDLHVCRVLSGFTGFYRGLMMTKMTAISGKLIVFEGGEGSGKTTQIQQLYDWLMADAAIKRLHEQNQIAGIKLT